MKAKRNWLIAGMIVGALFGISPVFGILGAFFGMNRAFETLGSSGIADPSKLSDDIGITLLSTAAGLVLFPVGAVIFTISFVFYMRLRAKEPPPLSRQ